MTKQWAQEKYAAPILANEFNTLMGGLLRSLEQKVRNEPDLRGEDLDDAIHHIERALVILVSLHINLTREKKNEAQ